MLAALLAAVVAAAAAVPPAPTRWVEDPAGLLSPSVEDRLDRRLAAYERATGHQVIVWVGDTIGDDDLADWAVRTFAAWKVGREGIDDGVILFVLAEDRLIDIEVGYGLEDRIPDVVASRIIREVMVPRLRAGEAELAVTEGVDALLAAIEGEPWTGGTTPPEAPPQAGPTIVEIVIGAIAVIGFLILLVTNPRLALLLLWTVGRGVGRGGGGGLGGFAGGGGRSGGGGARGSW